MIARKTKRKSSSRLRAPARFRRILFLTWVVESSGPLVGVLRRASRIRAANDPEAD
jgi:hypothetical protein